MKEVIISIPNGELRISVENQNFFISDTTNVVKLLKGIYSTRKDFEEKFLAKLKNIENKEFNVDKLYNKISELFNKLKKFSFEEAFKIKDESFKIMVFNTIDISDMINSLGAKRIKTDGITIKQKKFDNNGNFIKNYEMSNVFEIYEVSGKKLNLDENVYALKCWDTTTNMEHWLWIDKKYKDSPLDAVASTFRIHENIIPHIKEIKRQGDILFVEMKEGSENIKPEGKIVPLTSDQYFSLLTSQS